MNNNKIKIHVDLFPYKTKPNSKDIKIISQRITNKLDYLTPKELANKIKDGYTTMPFIMNGNRSKSNFKECQSIYLDFDNSYKKDGVYHRISNYISFSDMQKNQFIKDHASFMYVTHSNTDEINRYRVVFILDEIITNEQELVGIINYLIHKFPTADTSCKDISRLFYGGKEVVEVDYNNKLSTKYCIPDSNINNKINFESQFIIKPTTPESNKIVDIDFKNRYTFNTFINENEITKLIKNRKISEYREYLLQELDVDYSLIKSKKDLIYFINSLDLSLLLGIEHSISNSFKCVLTEDNNPSASIFKVPNKDMYLYKRFGDNGFVLTVLDVFRVLLHTNSKDTVLNFFTRVFNIKYAIPKNLEHTNKIINGFINHLNDLKEIKKTPYIHKVLYVHRGAISDLLHYLMDNPYYNTDKNEIEYLSSKSSVGISLYLYGNRSNTTMKKSNKIINLLTYLKVLKKLSFAEYPSTIKDFCMKNKKEKQNTNNVINLYVSDDVTLNSFLTDLEFKCEFLKENGYTFKGFSQDFITLTDSINESNDVFKQSKNKKISNHLIALITDLEKEFTYLFEELNNNYIIESELKSILKTKYKHTNNNLKINYNKALIIALNKFSLQKKKASNSIKSQFDIDADGFFNLICR